MDKAEFDTRLKELSVMVGSHQATELFNQGYEQLQNEVKAGVGADVRREFLLRLRTLGFLQQEYLMNLWLKLKRQTEMI